MKPTPRLLHIFSTFNMGGPQARAVQLINAWGRDFRHAIISIGRGELQARDHLRAELEIDFPDFPDMKTGSLFARLRRARDRVRELRPNLVLTYNWGAIEVVMALRLFGGAPLIHHEDGFGPEEAVRRLPRRNLFRRLALRGARRVVVPSNVLERIALSEWRQPADRVVRIPNGVDVNAFAPPLEVPAIPGFARGEDLVVGTVAGLRKEKNLTRLVRSFARAAQDMKAKLVIVGSGAEREAIRAEAVAEGIADKVYLPGFLPNPERYLALFDVFALSSDTEQFPISLVEAMAARLPVASTDVGDIASIVASENAPLIVPTDDDALAASLRALLTDGALRCRLGAANRARVEREYSLTAMVARYRRLYDDCRLP